MTKIRDLKGSKAVPQSSSLTVDFPIRTDDAILKSCLMTEMEWGKDVFPRMDEDEKLWTMEPFRLTDSNGDEYDDVQHVTLNDARTFGERVLAVLNESKELIVINGLRKGKEMDSHMTALIENFYRDVVYIADEMQAEILEPDLDAFFWEQLCIRGRVGARVLLNQFDGEFVPDILPIDMRNCVYGVGRGGINWVGFKDILDKYEAREMFPGANIENSEVVLHDIWNRTDELVYLDGTLVEAQPNFLGHPPFVIELCQQGTFLKTTQRARRMQGDSIFSANRDLYPHLSRIASIMQTQNMLTLSPPNKLTSKSGKKLPAEPIYRVGRTTALEVGEDLEKLDAPDIQSSTRFFQALLDGALQRGAISHVDWGNLQFQLSQVAIATLASASRQVFSPRLKSMSRFKRKLAKEIFWQMKYFDIKADIGRVGKKTTYTKADLEGDFTIDFEYYTALPEETAAAYGLAQMAQRWQDDNSIRRDILKYRNPDDVTEKYLAQQAERVSKSLALFVMAEALDKQGHPEKAKALLVEMAQMLNGESRQEVTNLSGMKVPQASPQQEAAVLESSQQPLAQRVTRKTEAPGTGEFEKEIV